MGGWVGWMGAVGAGPVEPSRLLPLAAALRCSLLKYVLKARKHHCLIAYALIRPVSVPPLSPPGGHPAGQHVALRLAQGGGCSSEQCRRGLSAGARWKAVAGAGAAAGWERA